MGRIGGIRIGGGVGVVVGVGAGVGCLVSVTCHIHVDSSDTSTNCQQRCHRRNRSGEQKLRKMIEKCRAQPWNVNAS